MTRRLTTVIGASLIALALIAPGTAAARQPDQIDPATMQPPLQQSFSPWTCWRTGSGIVCDGVRTDSWVNEPTPLVCDGRTVYSTGTDARTKRRFGDADGLALRERQHVIIHETITLQPDGSGPAISSGGRIQEWYEYLTPGDLSTRTDTYHGWDVDAIAPGVGLIFHDAGVKSFDIDDNVLFAHGPHPLLEDFFGTFGKLCDAFAEMGA